MKTRRESNRLIIDIHGMRVEQARFRLESLSESCAADIEEIVVIHGYSRGQALKEMLKELKSERIAATEPDPLNLGQTRIKLRRKKS